MENYIRLYEDSYQFGSIDQDGENDLFISTEHLLQCLSDQMEYRETDGILWGEIKKDGEVKRYKLSYKNFTAILEQVKFVG